MNTWRNSSIFRDYTLANCSHDWRVVDKSSTKRYRIYSKYTIEPTRSVNRIKCRIMVWYVESLRHLHSAQCSFSWRNNVAGWRCNSKRKSEEQLEWKVKNKFEKMRTHVKEIFRLLSFPAKQFLSLPGVRFKRFWHGNSASVRVQNPPKAFKTLQNFKTLGTGPYTGRDVRVGFSGRALPSNRADFLKTLHISLYFLKTS